MWWAVITLCTIGYGDMVPSTGLGKAVGAMACVSGVVMVALPISVISSTFQAKFQEHTERLKVKKSNPKTLTDSALNLGKYRVNRLASSLRNTERTLRLNRMESGRKKATFTFPSVPRIDSTVLGSLTFPFLHLISEHL